MQNGVVISSVLLWLSNGFLLLSFLTPTLVEGPVYYIHVSEGTSNLTESAVLILLRSVRHDLFANVGLYPILQGLQFDFKGPYSAYH